MVETEQGKLSKAQKLSIRMALKRTVHVGIAHKDGVLVQLFGKEKIPLIKQLYDDAGSFAKFLQMESLLSNFIILERMRKEYKQDGKLHSQYHQLQRNVDNLTVKVREQDEGIKFSGEVVHTHDDIRELVEKSRRIMNVETVEQRKTVIRGVSIFKSE